MSLIETALQKLRKAGDAAPDSVIGPAVRVAHARVMPSAPDRFIRSDIPARQIAIDMNSLRAAGYLPEEGLDRRFADHYRQIKRPLIEKALHAQGIARVIMITSALPGDGKTFTSINLALSMAREKDASVLLVDADAPKRRITQVFGMQGDRGLLDALADQALDVESLVVRTDVRGLEFLPAGKFAEGATELLASSRMMQLTSRLLEADPRRLVVIDSAPLLVSSEARAVTRVPGQIALVARAGATPRRALMEAIAQVDKTKLQGLILNHTVFRQGVGYYYGYSNYEGASTDIPPAKAD